MASTNSGVLLHKVNILVALGAVPYCRVVRRSEIFPLHVAAIFKVAVSDHGSGKAAA